MTEVCKYELRILNEMKVALIDLIKMYKKIKTKKQLEAIKDDQDFKNTNHNLNMASQEFSYRVSTCRAFDDVSCECTSDEDEDDSDN